MNEKIVITIGRQYGSGGHQVARELSKMLGIKMYDKELIDIAAKESGISENILKAYDEKPTNSFLYSLSLGAYSFENSLLGTPSIPLVDRVFAAQANIIKDIADKESCIFVGRCANSILEDRPNVLSVFIHTDIERRIDRICEYENISRAEASSIIRNADKKRASYYNDFSDLKWGDATAYDLCIDSRIGIENVAEVIKLFIEHHNAL
jgi:cytidylate kinase